MGTVSTPQALDALGSADLILAFGAGLNFHTTAQGGLMRGRRVVQVADRACDLGQGHVADVAILARPQDAADTLVQWLDAAEIPPSGFTRDLPAKGLDRPAPASARTTRAGTVDFLTTLERLESILPAPRTLVTDAGRWMVRSYGILTAPGPLDHVTTASFGSIGLGMGAAIGAAVARPDRPCVLACGDGGFMLGNLTELHSAVRAGLDLIVVIFNDGAYGAEHIQFRDRQRDPALTLFDWPDFVPLARALGAGGAELRSPADLEALLARLEERDRSRPFVIDVRLDPDQVAMW
jgi:thiamine pyrophosphate-dependent acetolactate synthase large subunit-like protein